MVRKDQKMKCEDYADCKHEATKFLRGNHLCDECYDVRWNDAEDCKADYGRELLEEDCA